MTIEWTEEGRARLATRLEALASLPGVPAEQRAAELTARVESKLRVYPGSVLTAAVLDATLDAVLAEESRRRRRNAGSVTAGAWFWLVCVLAPAVVLAFELTTRECTAMFFDPVPTLAHALAIAWVPVAAFLGLRARQANAAPALLRSAPFALGLALPVTCAYFIAFLPLTPLSVMGVAMMGLGLLSLTPVVCFPSLVALSVKVVRSAHARGLRVQRALWSGVAVSLFLVVLAEARAHLTNHWAQAALAGDAHERASALQRLRSFGSEHTLAGFASGSSSGWMSPLGLAHLWGGAISPDEGRGLWFRVFGEPFRGAPRRSFFADERFFDEQQGGPRIGQLLPGLELVSSRLDAAVDAEAGVAYVEWILEVENLAEWGMSEARALVELPDEAVVSRATLWIGDEEREAAYAGSSAARAAYEAVALVQRLDPLLVTSAGDDHGLAQV
ncbi:MAG: hypothetical protein ABL998_11535, partial [Planctomycetota bacterium]